jgi:hypothetical protein
MNPITTSTALALPAPRPVLTHRLSVTGAITRAAHFHTGNVNPDLVASARDYCLFFRISEIQGEFTLWMNNEEDEFPLASGAGEFVELSRHILRLADLEDASAPIGHPIGRGSEFVTRNFAPEMAGEYEGAEDFHFYFHLERDADGTLSMWFSDGHCLARNTREMRCLAAHLEHLAFLEHYAHLDLTDVDAEDYLLQASI